MAAPATITEFLDLVRKSAVLDEKRLDAHLGRLRSAGTLPNDPGKLAGVLVRDGILTHFQAEQIMLGKWRRFTIGKYKVLERLGSGGMGSVYLCEHKLMRRRVAVKVLPTAKAAEPSSLERFYREARAVAALDHPNIVHAYDIDQDESLHFLVMEYVDGASLQEMVKRTGPMEPTRAAHYMRQAAMGLEHAHAAGLVHRDIKPGNLLVERGGVLKILDMGLARFFNDEEDILTKKFDENVLGTADYLAPEQALDSHSVDIRADIYSLGATFYFLLTGRTPFGEGTVAQKLIWHQTRQPKPLSSYRSDVPAGLTALVEKMMAKDPAQRYQTPAAVYDALAPWTQTPIGPPPEAEMPRLSPAATGVTPAEQVTQITPSSALPPLPAPPAPTTRHAWQASTPPPTKPIPLPEPRTVPRDSEVRPVHISKVAAAPSVIPLPPTPQVVGTNVSAAPRPAGTATASQGENLAWDAVTPAAEDSEAQEDTGPNSDLTGHPSSRHLASLTQAQLKVKERRRFWTVSLAVSGVFLVVLGVLLFRFFLSRTPETPPVERKPREVTQDGRPNSFRSIQQALRDAQPGDVIELLDGQHQENLVVEPGRTSRTSRVTLQARTGKTVVWTGSKGKEKDPLLQLNNAEGFTLKGKGITLDGRGEATTLILLYLHCPDLTVEDVELKNFKHSAIQLTNCTGDANRPVRVVNVKTTTQPGEKEGAAIFFDASANTLPSYNDFIDIVTASSTFTGLNFNTAVRRKDATVVGGAVKLSPPFEW